MTRIEPKALDKIGKLIPRLASDHAGEVTATVAAMQRTLASAGASLHDLVELLQREPVERVVYRDRIVEKVVEVEVVVFRDPPPLAADTMTAARASDVCASLLELAEITDKQRDFVQRVAERASRGQDGFTLTEKQWVWLFGLVDRYLSSPSDPA